MPPLGYQVRKAAQVVAFLVNEQGRTADFIKTVKLAYMADRRFMDLYDVPILYDDLASMEHGPVDSATYNYMKGIGADRERITWEKYLRNIDDSHKIQLTKHLSADDFDELSDAEIKILRETAKYFKNMQPFQMVDWIHLKCSEWENPGKTSKPLPYKKVFRALGKKHSEALEQHVMEIRHLLAANSKAK